MYGTFKRSKKEVKMKVAQCMIYLFIVWTDLRIKWTLYLSPKPKDLTNRVQRGHFEEINTEVIAIFSIIYLLTNRSSAKINRKGKSKDENLVFK